VSRRSGGGVVVANPSSTPEAIQAAQGLAEAGLLERYHLPLATTAKLERRVGRLPRRISEPMLRELRRRALPAEIPVSAVRSTATIADLRRVAAGRLGRSWAVRKRLGERQMATFDTSVARRLDAGDGAVFAVTGWGLKTIRRAAELSVPVVVDCPLGHHGYVRELMREEARLQPEWAGTLQVHDFPDHLIEAHVEELDRADLVLVLSSHARAVLLDQGIDESKLVTTSLGVDLDLFRPRSRADDGVFRVIFVGQVTQRKGLSYLVEGFERAAIPNSELLIVGEPVGTADPWLGRPGIRHVPAMPRAELPHQYARADVYVLPSLAEGFALTAIEAMASGLPVILSDRTFGGDLVTEAEQGFIVPIRDSAAIAERLTLLADDPDRRRRMGRAARARAEQFPWSRYREQVVEIMRRVLQGQTAQSTP
jgi:glycosyltransferase involved in cell wall biosynthesis